MESSDKSTALPLSLKIDLRFWDMIAYKFLIQWITPFLWFYLFLFIYLGYKNAFPILLEKQYMFFLTALAINFIWMSTVIIFVSVAMVAAGFSLNRVKGIAGEHEFIFDTDRFTEKTAINENIVKYGKSIRLYETKNYLFMATSLFNYYCIPKRFLSSPKSEALMAFLKTRLNCKRSVIHYAMTVSLVVSVIFVGFVYNSTRYTVISRALPFQAIWNDHVLYIYGGRTVMGRRIGLGEFTGLGPFSGQEEEMQKNDEHILWVAEKGQIERYPIKSASVMQIFFFKGRLCGVGFSEGANQDLFHCWNGKEFVKEPEEQYREYVSEMEKKTVEMANEGPAPTRISNLEWDGRVGAGKEMVLSLDGQQFKLMMNNKRASDPMGAGSFTLSGGWGDTLQDLYFVKEGLLKSGKEEFENLFVKR